MGIGAIGRVGASRLGSLIASGLASCVGGDDFRNVTPADIFRSVENVSGFLLGCAREPAAVYDYLYIITIDVVTSPEFILLCLCVNIKSLFFFFGVSRNDGED